MKDTHANIMIALFSVVPYLLVSWAYMEFANGGTKEFWTAFGVLIAVRLFFSVIETLGSIVSWRIFGKKLMVDKLLRLLRENNFPKREYRHDNFMGYLSRVEGGPYAESVKTSAKEIYFLLATYESMGILLGMRMHAASEAALEAYSPKAEAAIWGASHA